ncbi:MAG: hypothetical protein AcusKO_27560 [Acuticoccus sp.]
MRGTAAGKDAELARCHRHRPAARQGVFQCDRGAPGKRGIPVDERAGALYAEDRADLKVVLQVLANAGELVRTPPR